MFAYTIKPKKKPLLDEDEIKAFKGKIKEAKKSLNGDSTKKIIVSIPQGEDPLNYRKKIMWAAKQNPTQNITLLRIGDKLELRFPKPKLDAVEIRKKILRTLTEPKNQREIAFDTGLNSKLVGAQIKVLLDKGSLKPEGDKYSKVLING